MRHRWLSFFAAAAVPLAGASGASAATLTVDDDRADCPAAAYTSVQAAVDAAAPRDTVVVCPGVYVEGSGAPASNALTIAKNLTLKGAGADLVTISPRATTFTGSSIAGDRPDVRSGAGSIVAVLGTPRTPVSVAISGVTVDGEDRGRPVASTAGVVYLDAIGSIAASRVTNVVTSEGAAAYTRVGGWRSDTPGYGIVQTSATLVGIPGERRLEIVNTRVDRYNRVGVLIDGATNDTAPFAASGITNKGIVSTSQIVGRVECADFEANGNCSQVGLLTTGPLFGQDGIRVTNNSRLTVTDSLVSQNLVNGTGAPVRSTWDGRARAYVPATTDNANLRLGAGVRLLGASLTNYSDENGQTIYSSATRSNITDNAYGVLNLAADGTTDASGDPTSEEELGDVFKAEGNWWGLGYYRTLNGGPQIAPTDNPPIPENPLNGVGTPDGTGQTSDAVDFFPFRGGSQGDPFNGQLPIVDAPQPVDDAAPSGALSASGATAAPGATITLTATASDDFGVRSVTFFDGSTRLPAAATPPYSVAATVPADAACGSVRSYGAVIADSSGQTSATAPVSVTVQCTAPPEERPPGRRDPDVPSPPGPPTVRFGPLPTRLSKATTISFEVTAPAGFSSAVVTLGSRTVCTIRSAPYRCTIRPLGADVGTQALRVVVTDAKGSTATATADVTVPRFKPRLRTTLRRRAVRGGKVKRTLRVTLVRPAGVTARQACGDGHLTLVIKRGQRTVLNRQVRLSGSCTVTRSITAPRRAGRFALNVRFSGNATLDARSTSRRFT